MIKSKAQFIKAVRANKDAFLIKTLTHPTHWQVGKERPIARVFSNSMTLLTYSPAFYPETTHKESWVMFSDLIIKDNIITFKDMPITMEIIEVESQKA